MMSKERSFWANPDSVNPRPLETAISKVEPAVMADFMKAGFEIYNAITLVNPDVIFFPERGAAPFRWAVEALEVRNERNFFKVPLMIGTETEVSEDTQHGQTKPVKRENVRRGIEIAQSQIKNIQRPMLVDEVQLGGTIRVASQYMLLELRRLGINSPIYIVAVQDTTGDVDKKRARGYKTLVSNTRPAFRSAIVNTQLFHMDNQMYLNHELVDYEAHASDIRPLPMLMHNVEAERFIKNMMIGYVNPQSLKAALDSLQGSNGLVMDEDARVLADWIGSFMSGLTEKSWVNRRDTLQWFIEFYQISVGKDPSQNTALVR